CAWLQKTSPNELVAINSKLLVAKRVFTQFWQLQDEVRTFFLEHAEQPTDEDKPRLQVIELMCNEREVAQELTLAVFDYLLPLLLHPGRLPDFIRSAVLDYQDNKGTRGWNFPDRRILPLAWRDAARRG